MTDNFTINDYVDNSSKDRRVSARYLGTTEYLSDVQEVQEYIRNTNKMLRRVGMPTVSVKIGTRLGRDNPHAEDIAPGQWVPMDIAERFDVYLKENF